MGDPATWDLLDEDCSDISDWVDNDNKDGVSEVSPAGQFHFYCPSPETAEYARRDRDIGSYPTSYTVEIKLKHTTLGNHLDNDYFTMLLYRATHHFGMRWAADGLFCRDSGGFPEVGTDLVQTGVWQTWRFLVDLTGGEANGVCDIYLNGILKASGIDCDLVGGPWTDGATALQQYGYTVSGETHVDYIKVATGLYTPEVIGNAVFFGANF